MGWTVLYIAFGIVALWLLGEVLLQYKARLRWRLVAFFGFLGVVVGVVIPSVPVIAVGTAAFATGQTFVTLSFRRGFSTGWALGGKPGESRRRRAEPADAPPTLEVSGMEETHQPSFPPADLPPPPEQPAGPPPPEAYQPEPMPDETGEYAAYHGPPPAAPSGFDPLGSTPFATDGPQYAGAPGGDQPGPDPALGPYAAGYGYGHDDQYSVYSDPYIGGSGAPSTPYDPYQDPYSDHDRHAFAPGEPDQHQYADPYATADPLTGGYPAQGYDPGGQGYDPYSAAAQPGYPQTPPGGVWVPPQRDGEATGGYPTGPTDPGYGYPDSYGYPEGYPTGGYPAGGYPSGYPDGYATGEYQPGEYPTGDHPVSGYPDGYQPGYPDGDGYTYGGQQRY